MSWQIPTFGIRHLSPMGAWHLRAFLDQQRPTLVLVEGPDDATALLADVTKPQTEPPLAILAYTDSQPVRTIVYPFARYSPEYQAICWAHAHDVPVEFFDLPSDVFLGLQDREIEHLERLRREAESAPAAPVIVGVPEPRPSLFQQIADLAGERDYDTYWERHFEHTTGPGTYHQSAMELGRVIRELEEDAPRWRAENLVREAYMRRRVGQAIAAGHSPDRIVAVVGAFHGAAITGDLPEMTDAELAILPRRASKLTLMPYSYFRLSSQSGYGAGNHAPAYFELLWQAIHDQGVGDLSRRYLSLVARHLREAGTHRSTAEVIDAVRLAETLAALKDSHAPTLADLRDAAITLLGQGEPLVVKEAMARVNVGTAIGRLPKGVSQTSIQADFDRELHHLRLEKYRTVVAEEIDLDLRENRRAKTEESAFLDLRRSSFFHRLRVLEIQFAKPLASRQQSATWAEKWLLQWTPESEIQLVEAVLLGETLELATAYKFKTELEACATIADAADLVRQACLCGLMKSMDLARQRLQELAATSREFTALAAAAWNLAQVVRYGDVRRFDPQPLLPLLEELFVEAALSLFAASTCDDKAARGMMQAVDEVNRVGLEFHDLVDEALWIDALQRLADADDRNPRLSGHACAILLERGLIENEALAREVARRLSPGVPADLGAGWFEGLASRNRHALLARQTLWEQLASYIAALDEDDFRRALVFLRRAFGPFSPREKRQITENLGELWGLNPDSASDLIEQPLSDAEAQSLEDLNTFDFDVQPQAPASGALMLDPQQLARWRLILGKDAQEGMAAMSPGGLALSAEQAEMDEVLEALYESGSDQEIRRDEWESPSERGPHGTVKGRSMPRVARWLDQIRNFFPRDVVVLLQHDAIERRGMKELLFEPEIFANVEPSVDLAAAVLELKNLVPEKAKAAARDLVRRVVEELRKRLETGFAQAVRGSIDRSEHSPLRSLPNLDWPRTIRRNLKHYNTTVKTIIPEEIAFFRRRHRQNEWNVIIAMDQSGSMATSLIYGGIMGAILASLPAVETHVVAFNHQEVVDLTALCDDPVDLLFGVQLGGAEDYWKATSYCERFMHTPAKTLYILIADLHDTSPNEQRFVRKMEFLLESGLRAVTLLAISDQGQPSFNQNLAEKLSKLGMPCFGCTPDRLPDLLAAVLKGQDLQQFGDQARLK